MAAFYLVSIPDEDQGGRQNTSQPAAQATRRAEALARQERGECGDAAGNHRPAFACRVFCWLLENTQACHPEAKRSLITMSRTYKIILAVSVLVVAFIVAAALVAPRVFQVDHYRPELISLLESQTGRRVEIGRLSLRVFPSVSIRVDQFAVGNPPGFPRENWLSVQEITAALDSAALWHRQIIIHALDLKNPVLRLRSNPQGQWNCEFNPATGPTASPEAIDPPPQRPASQPARPLFSIREVSELKIDHGTVIVIAEAAGGQPGGSNLQADGVAARLEHISLQGLLGNPAAASEPNGITSLISTGLSGNLNSEEVTFGNLRITGLQSKLGTAPERLLLDPVDFNLYGGKATGKITLRAGTGSATPAYLAQASFAGVNAGKLLDEFSGLRGSLTGTLGGSLTASGELSTSPDPWAGKQGQGIVVVRNGRWPKLELNSTLWQLAQLAQLGPASGDLSAFSSVTADWRLAGEVLTTSSIKIAGSGITGSASGTVDLKRGGLLSYEGVGHIPAHANVLTNVLAGISGSTLRGNQLSVSFTIRGTLARPVFQLKSSVAPGPSPASGAKHNQRPQVLQNIFKAPPPRAR